MKDDTNGPSAAELRMLEAIREQRVCDFADGADITAEEMTVWGPERIVRAARLRQLLTAENAEYTAHAIQLRGAIIDGVLDLAGLSVISLQLEHCRVDTVVATDARFIGDSGFEGATFTGDARFEGATFTGDARFGGATFTGTAGFDRTSFFSDAWFRTTTFTGAAEFNRATFSGTAGFGGALFTGTAEFDGTTFNNTAWFENATFSGTAGFNSANFTGAALFAGATFTGDSSFGDTSFTGTLASFTGATFNGNAGFDHAIVSGDSIFGGATFKGNAGFSGAAFKGNAGFSGAAFKDNAAFDRATFTSAALFERTTFKGKAEFAGAKFTGNAEFSNAIFAGSAASFAGAKFTGNAGFSRAICSGDALFEHAAFGRDASFDGATVTGNAGFDGATFTRNASFAGATFKGNAGFGNVTFEGTLASFASASFNGDASFADAAFTDNAGFNGATFAGGALFSDATFTKNAGFNGATFIGDALFSDATFTKNAVFSGATFLGDAGFARATFSNNAGFDDVTFSGAAGFNDATFARDALFKGTMFTRTASFDHATFINDAWFDGVTFTGDALFRSTIFRATAWFGDAIAHAYDFRRAQFHTVDPGPWIGLRVTLIGAVFHLRARVAVAAVESDYRRLQSREGVHLVCLGGAVDLEDAEFLRRSILAHSAAEPSIPERPNPGEPPEGFDDLAPDVKVRWAAQQGAFQLEQKLVGELGTQHLKRTRMVSLRRATAGDLVLSGIRLEDCAFAGAHGLDRLRIDATCSFPRPPIWPWRTWRPFTGRRVIYEETQWRRAHTLGWAPGFSAAAAAATPDLDRPMPTAQEIAGIYRDLRKALEDSKDEPGAADFYYGEMEMRRLAARGHRHQGVRAMERRPSWTERRMLDAYWAISGYGLRAWRAMAALTLLLLACAALFTLPLFAHLPDPPQQVSSVDLRTGVVRYAPSAQSGVKPDTSAAVPFATSLEFTARESLTLTRTSGAPLLQTTGTGTALDIALRLLAPLLLGLAVLAVRGRIKR